jgi:Caspase domain
MKFYLCCLLGCFVVACWGQKQEEGQKIQILFDGDTKTITIDPTKKPKEPKFEWITKVSGKIIAIDNQIHLQGVVKIDSSVPNIHIECRLNGVPLKPSNEGVSKGMSEYTLFSYHVRLTIGKNELKVYNHSKDLANDILIDYKIDTTDNTQPLSSCKGLALLIGNYDYTLWGPLTGPKHDIRYMKAVLEQKGYHVLLCANGNKVSMQDAIQKFIDLQEKYTSIPALLYYSGHGYEVNGQNYMIPIDCNKEIVAIQEKGIKTDSVVQKMKKGLIILDACRESKGIIKPNEVPIPKGTGILYGTIQGNMAGDIGHISHFTKYLLKHLSQKDADIQKLIKGIAEDIKPKPELMPKELTFTF